MLDILLVILAFIGIIILSLLSMLFLIQLSKEEIPISKLIVVIFSCFGYGVYLDCFRIIYLYNFGPIYESLDIFLFCGKIFLILVGLSAIIRLILLWSRQTGHKVKQESIIRLFNIIMIGVITVVNMFTFYKSNLTESGFYSFQVHPVLFFTALGLWLPILIFITFRVALLFKEIRNKTFTNQTFLLGLLFLLLIYERYFNVGANSFLLNSDSLLILDFSMLLAIFSSAYIYFLKNPNLLEVLSTYFSVKSIIIILKSGGQMLFSYDFHEEDSEKILSPKRILLGGFIHAVSFGLEHTLEKWGKMETIKIGDITLIFKHGKHVLGIIFITEETRMVHFKLIMLMQRFENRYEKELEHWKGDLTQFDSKQLQNWVYEIFR